MKNERITVCFLEALRKRGKSLFGLNSDYQQQKQISNVENQEILFAEEGLQDNPGPLHLTV